MGVNSLTKHARNSIKKESSDIMLKPKRIMFTGFYGYSHDGKRDLYGRNSESFTETLVTNLRIGKRYEITIVEVD